MEPYLLWVAGRHTPGEGQVLDIVDPATGEAFAKCHTPSQKDIDVTMSIACDTHRAGRWANTPRETRAQILEKAGELLHQNMAALIDLEVRQTGRAIREMEAQVPSLVRWFKYFAALLRTEERPVLPTSGQLHNWVDRKAIGVIVQITPFNHPLLIAVKKLVPALAAGNCVVLKPSELTPLTSLLLGPIMKHAGLPDGVFNILPGLGHTTGQALAGHLYARKVDITAGTAVGKAIGQVVGRNLTIFAAELGGKAPVVIFESADLDVAANGIAFGAFIASGQTCVAATRILVQNSIFHDLVNKLRRKADFITKRMGSPQNRDTMMGPLISSRGLTHIEGLIDEATRSHNAALICGGTRLKGRSKFDGTDFSRGNYFPPTLLVSAAVNNSITQTRIWREEAFGPVLTIVGFETEKEAIALANDTKYSLGAGIWTKDLSQAHRVSDKINAGIVWINTHHRNDPSSPWGGLTAESGIGCENGMEAYRAYTMTKSTIINYASDEDALRNEDWFRDQKEGESQVRYG